MRASVALLAFFVLAGCSNATTVNFGSGPSSTSSGSGGPGSGTGGSSTSSTGAGGVHLGAGGSGAGGGGGSAANAEVFGHSATELYKLDPITKVVTDVGPFQGCDADINAVIDMALDKDSNMYVTTFGGFYKVDKTTAQCTLITSSPEFPNSLSFVPIGTLDPNKETLVGYQGATYISIDTTTGAINTVGSLGGMGYISSGDIVSVIGGGTYLTVQGGPENCGDCLIEVDPVTGAFKKMIGSNLGYADVFGIAFWGGSVYGFDDVGDLFQVDLASGTTTAIPIPNAPPALSFFGAASTTSAPLKPPTQ